MGKLFKILVMLTALEVFCAPSAFAVFKLSDMVRAAKEKMNEVKDYYDANQEKINEVATEALKYKRLAENGELGEYLKQTGMDKAKGYANDNVNKYKDKAKEKVDEVKDKAKEKGDELKEKYEKKFEDFKQKEKQKKAQKAEDKLNAATAKRQDYEAAFKAEQDQKNQQIDAELTELNAKLKSQNITEDEYNKLVEEIALLEAQKQANMDKQIENDSTYKSLKDEEEKLAKNLQKLKPEADQEGIEEELSDATLGLFADEESTEDENKSIYQTEIDALFLKEGEESTSENLARIKRERNYQYYMALQNVMRIVVGNTESSTETEEDLEEFIKTASDVQGNYAIKGANIGVVLENAKVAARFTEALLAEIRFKTLQDITSWNNKNRLYDYSKPVTEFDLDYYELKKNDLMNKAKAAIKKGKGKAEDKVNDFLYKI